MNEGDGSSSPAAKRGRATGARGNPSRGSRPRRAGEPRSAQQAIVAALSFNGISDEVRAQRVLDEWSELVGAKIASRTRPERVAERVLVIEVASSAWLHELTLLKAQILAGLIDRLGLPRLFDDLKFRLAGRTQRVERTFRLQTPGPRPRPAAAPPPRPATGIARDQIVREVGSVDDLELRELIARVRIANDR